MGKSRDAKCKGLFSAEDPGGTSSVDVSLYTERHLRLFLVVAPIVASPWVAAAVVRVWHHARS